MEARSARAGFRGLSSAHGFSVGVYILIVFFDGVGEAVMALGVGDEIIVVALRRVHGGFEGAASGIADGAGRESRIVIGVVGRVELHVGVMKCALIGSGQKFCIDDAGVGVESDAFGEAIVVHARD